MAANKIWVGSIPSSVKDDELRNAMEKYGSIKQLYYRPIAGNRGWAFVTFATQDQAEHAMRQIHGKLTFPDSARPLEARPPENNQEKQNTSSNTSVNANLSSYSSSTNQVCNTSNNNLHSNNISLPSPTSSVVGAAIENNNNNVNLDTSAFENRNINTSIGSGEGGSIPSPPETTCTPVYLWQQYVRSDGHVYFYNTITGHTQWEKPILTKEVLTLLQGNVSNIPPPHNTSLSNNLNYYMNYLNNSPSSTTNAKPGAGRSYGPPGSNLFIFHLPAEWSELQLKEHFNFFGNIVSCRVSTDNVGRNSGFGFVSFDNQASAVSAKNLMNGVGVGGKFLKVQIKKGEEQHLRSDLANQLK